MLANLVVTSLFSCVLTSPEHTTQPAKIKAIFRKEKGLKSLRTEVGKGGRKKQLYKVMRLKGAGEVGGSVRLYLLERKWCVPVERGEH